MGDRDLRDLQQFDPARDVREIDKTIRPTAKSRIVGLGWPDEAAPFDTSPDQGQDVEKASQAEQGVGEGRILFVSENLPMLLAYMKPCEAKLEELRTRAEGVVPRAKVRGAG